MIALIGRCQAAIRAFSGFPAVSLPRLRFHRKIVCKAMIANEFSRQRESEKKFFPEFPSRQGKRRYLPSSLWRRGRLRLGRSGSGLPIPVIALRAIPRPTARRRNWAGTAGGGSQE